ncbi:MAG: hypothetical protein UV76_C0009G0006 [Candidatus Nomurabacteria bacterium GW2011_GWA2_43_15]|uniref:PKD domain-containing protein n=1 Tax=Candidatus Nomurabacteria bacterium GW2011_GWA2_43_15 TaxID=1618738 RepID=A0A0G1FZW2_9BACT|nr:MAG: hypothetical protein UV76_C0009G0006 [Candidatus Nomurabacteria bacterium GW2011_GWA2_43_15]
MKKYILFLFVFIFGLFFTTNFISAQTASGTDCVIYNTLRLGSVGSEVSCLQTQLGITADGNFGPATKAALMAWQNSVGLTADGVLGTRSRAILNGTPIAVPSLPAGCTSTSGYSVTTGEPCGTSYPPGCTSNTGYSVTTGTSCGDPYPYIIYPNGGEQLGEGSYVDIKWFAPYVGYQAKIALLRIDAPSGTERPIFYASAGVAGENTLPSWKVEGISAYSGGPTSGWYKISLYQQTVDGYEYIRDYSDDNFQIVSGNTSSTSPVISGVSGPQALNVGQTGTWKVSASDPSGGNLSYSVKWGDELTGSGQASSSAPTSTSYTQTATFTHSYATAGIYEPVFYVRNASGAEAKTSLSVNVGNSTLPFLALSLDPRSPNYALYNPGDKDATLMVARFEAMGADINVDQVTVCAQTKNPLDLQNIEVSVDGDKVGSTYSLPYWNSVKKCYWGSIGDIDWDIQEGDSMEFSFKADINSAALEQDVKLAIIGVASNDKSLDVAGLDLWGNTIKIASGTNASPEIGPIAILDGIRAGQSVNFNFSATDANNDDLSWSLYWGEGPGSTTTCPVNPTTGSKKNWNYSTSHTWAKAGTYKVEVTVNDCRGGYDGTSFTVNVGSSTTTPSVTVLSPNGGEVLTAGKNLDISWKVTGAEHFVGTRLSLLDLNGTVLRDLNGPAVTSVLIGNSINGTNYSSDLGTGPGYSGVYIVKVCLVGNSVETTLCDTSNSYFRLASATTTPSVTVLSPNGGESLVQGKTIKITWKDSLYNKSTSKYNITLRSAANFYSIAKESYPGGGDATGLYSYWIVGTGPGYDTIPNDTYILHICNAITSACDYSDGYFQIVSGTTTNVAPKITSLLPASGPVGTGVVITGTGFTSYDNTVNGISSMGNFQVSGKMANYNQTKIGFAIPKINTYGGQLVPGVYAVQVGNAGGSSNNLNFTVTNTTAPKITSLSPTSVKPGDTVYITGSNFIKPDMSNNNYLAVSLYGPSGSQIPNPTFISSTSLSFVVPSNYASGKYTVAVFQNFVYSNGVELNVTSPDSLSITTPSPLPNAKVGTAYNLSIQGTPVAGPYNWSLVFGSSWPPGLVMNSSPCYVAPCSTVAVISGTPTTAGTYVFTIGASYNSQSTTKRFSLTVDPATTTPSITVLSPNGGEVLTQGQNHKITWTGNGISTVFAFLVPANSTGNGAGSLGAIGSVSSGNVIYWDAKTVWSDINNANSATTIQPGSYKIYLVGNVANVLGQTVNDMSNSAFTITSATTTATLPTVYTTAVTNITTNSATSGGYVLVDGGAPVTARGITYNSATKPTLSNLHTSDGTGTGEFTSNFTQNLRPGTTFYVRAYATNSKGTAYGNEVFFTTAATTTSTYSGTSASTNTPSTTSNGGTLTPSSASCYIQAGQNTCPINFNWSVDASTRNTYPGKDGFWIDYTYLGSSAQTNNSGTQSSLVVPYGGKTFSLQIGERISPQVKVTVATATVAATCNPGLSWLNGSCTGSVLGAQGFNFTQTLKVGSQGNEVTELQLYLTRAGYDIGVADGKFGPLTEAAVLKLQADKGLKVDGIVGPEVRAVLNG